MTRGPSPAPDVVVRSIGLPRHPPVDELQEHARVFVDTLSERVLLMAHNLASRGYAATTLGDGGSRGTDSTSSTERNGERYLPSTDDDGNPVPIPGDVMWLGADVKLAGYLRDVDLAVKRAKAYMDLLMQHAADLDKVPAGTGTCEACSRFCRPSKDKPGNRIMRGFCPTCYRAWARAGRPERSGWIRQRQKDLTDDAGVLHVPEADPTIDLSREIPA